MYIAEKKAVCINFRMYHTVVVLQVNSMILDRCAITLYLLIEVLPYATIPPQYAHAHADALCPAAYTAMLSLHTGALWRPSSERSVRFGHSVQFTILQYS